MCQSAPCKVLSDFPNWSCHFALDHLQAFNMLKTHVGSCTADGCCSFGLCWAFNSGVGSHGWQSLLQWSPMTFLLLAACPSSLAVQEPLSHTHQLSGGVFEYSRHYEELLWVLLQSSSLWEWGDQYWHPGSLGAALPESQVVSPSVWGSAPCSLAMEPHSGLDSTEWRGEVHRHRGQPLELKILIYWWRIKN